MTDVASVMRELEEASSAVDRASTELYNLQVEFEGKWVEGVADDGTGEIVKLWEPGSNLRWRVAVTTAIEEIVDDKYADKRVPSAERLERQAEIKVMKEQPDLYADYHSLKSKIEASRIWISARKQTISARQSVLGAERALVNG